MNPALWGPLAVGLALVLGGFVLVAPHRAHLPRSRRRPEAAPEDGALAEAAATATRLVAKAMRRREGSVAIALDLAGVRRRPQDVVFLVLVGFVVLGALGLLIGGPWLMVLFALVAPIATVLWVRVRTSRRRAAFADQLDDTLQLIAGSLRAGHSLLQALAGVAQQADDPTSSELARIVNETRVGRPLSLALEEAAIRMANEDFSWVAQAITINREVGGNLADVLENVGVTIRERNQIRRHVDSLSADGRLSGIILVALPFLVAGFLLLTNPTYLAPFIQNPIGIAALVVCAILLVIGTLWMRKVVTIRF
ncbi:type II secretion system F family protein [Isoptericola sp. AK164]|uniref:type II secretion system F family protein n=1 Tax=Isoptericola sp. AK164 TaxID=3024246 RepID=UPI002418A6A6|nr:type II secretion system F family protein [Isoptericola sp. AK164]